MAAWTWQGFTDGATYQQEFSELGRRVGKDDVIKARLAYNSDPEHLPQQIRLQLRPS